MSLTKIAMIDDIRGSVWILSDHMLASGVKEGYLDLPDTVDILPMTMIRPAYKWINTILDTEYVEVKRIWDKLPQATWEMYEAIGDFDEHREVILLRRARTNLRERIVSLSRPDLFKKTKVKNAIKAKLTKKT